MREVRVAMWNWVCGLVRGRMSDLRSEMRENRYDQPVFLLLHTQFVTFPPRFAQLPYADHEWLHGARYVCLQEQPR